MRDFVWAGAAAKSGSAVVEQSVQATLNRAAEEFDALRGIAEIVAEDLFCRPRVESRPWRGLCHLSNSWRGVQMISWMPGSPFPVRWL